MQKEAIFSVPDKGECIRVTNAPKYDGLWYIDSATRYLEREVEKGVYDVHTTLSNDRVLQQLYYELGNRKWGSVGQGDLLEGYDLSKYEDPKLDHLKDTFFKGMFS